MFDDFSFAPEKEAAYADDAKPWQILIVDDEEEVHQVTAVALIDLKFKGRPIAFLHAYSAAEAREVLRTATDIAIVLLDVVMEEDDAGLKLVRHIRDQLRDRRVRIVLRTGQPGQAPERDVVMDYDINDYKSKTELTRQKLLTCVVSALRAYDDIVLLEKNRNGLQQVIVAADTLLQSLSEESFAGQVLRQVNALIGHPCAGVVVSRTPGSRELRTVQAVDAARSSDAAEFVIAHALETQLNVYTHEHACLYIRPLNGSGEYAIFLPLQRGLTELECRLIDLLCTNIAAGLSNVQLYESLVHLTRDLESQVVERTRELSVARDAAEAASRAKSEFLAVMSHEIRTPMNGVLGMMQLALGEATDPAQREHLETAQYSAEALLAILNDILDFSRLEAGNLEFDAAHFDLFKTVDSVVKLMDARTRAASLSLSADYAPDLPRMLVGDAGRLRQVLLNLLSNALKFTERGGVSLHVDRLAGDAEQVLLRFTVIDSGIGIAPEAQGRLFQSFSQADGSISRRFGGTGLGLSICRKIVELQGGRIGVDSTLGVGSRFWFELAFAPCVDDVAPAPAEALAPCSEGLRILLAEDNEINQKVASSLLKKAGHTVHVVPNGHEAVRAVQADAYDVILMDMHMPEMDGLAATRAIRGLPAPASNLPIVALTAAGALSDIQTCMDAGMNYFLVKPFRMERLGSILSALPARGG
ncbi:MAG TPA: response regulator [Oxalicibacterium sp.]|nr:response regulator [Oxalicibacterium sp.]